MQLNPPDGLTCYAYLQPFIDVAGGYMTNPNATTGCNYCAYENTDQFMASNFNITYSHRWRDVGLMFVYAAFNVRRFPPNHRMHVLTIDVSHVQIWAVYAFTYIFRIRFFNPFAFIGPLRRRLARLRKPKTESQMQ